jgi:hypothetical protein
MHEGTRGHLRATCREKPAASQVPNTKKATTPPPTSSSPSTMIHAEPPSLLGRLRRPRRPRVRGDRRIAACRRLPRRAACRLTGFGVSPSSSTSESCFGIGSTGVGDSASLFGVIGTLPGTGVNTSTSSGRDGSTSVAAAAARLARGRLARPDLTRRCGPGALPTATAGAQSAWPLFSPSPSERKCSISSLMRLMIRLLPPGDRSSWAFFSWRRFSRPRAPRGSADSSR